MNRSKKKLSKIVSRTLLTLAAQGIVASTVSVAGTIYYVGPGGQNYNSGTEASPFRTIRYAAQRMIAGDETIVLDGIYKEPMVKFENSGTEAQPITLKSQHPHGAILSSTSGCQPAIGLYASYVIIEDLKIVVDDENTACPEENSDNGAVRAWGGAMGYDGPNAANPDTIHSHCIIRGLRIEYSVERAVGIKVNQDYCLVENNHIESSLEALNTIGNVFRNNTIIGGDIWGSSIYGKGGVRNMEIYNNEVHVKPISNLSPSGHPITPLGLIIGGDTGRDWVWDQAAPFEAYNTVAYNNVIVNETGGNIYALGMMGAKDSALFNNVVVGPGWLFLRDGYNAGASLPVAKSTDPIIRNNIFSCGGGNVFHSSSYFWSYNGTVTLNNNNFYNCVGAPSQTNAVTGDPLLVNPASDWHVQTGSPAIGSGYAIPSFTDYNSGTIATNLDKDGVARSTPWDVGIYVIDTDGDGVRNSADNCPSTANAMQTDIDANSVGDACQHGLTASYFNDSDTNSSGLITEIDDKLVAPAVLQRIDSNVDFNWGLYSSPASGVVTTDYFSTRWTGRLVVPAYTGTYEFCLKGDDGVRLWVNNVDLFGDEHWVPQDSVKDCATINLTAGQAVPIKVEFFDLTEEGIVQLTWSWPGQAEVVVPGSALYAE